MAGQRAVRPFVLRIIGQFVPLDSGMRIHENQFAASAMQRGRCTRRLAFRVRYRRHIRHHATIERGVPALGVVARHDGFDCFVGNSPGVRRFGSSGTKAGRPLGSASDGSAVYRICGRLRVRMELARVADSSLYRRTGHRRFIGARAGLHLGGCNPRVGEADWSACFRSTLFWAYSLRICRITLSRA